MKFPKYFRYRNSLISRANDRVSLGFREIETLRLALGTSVNFLNDKTLVDLGCGDGYLRQAVEVGGVRYIGIDAEYCDLALERIHIEAGSFAFAFLAF